MMDSLLWNSNKHSVYAYVAVPIVSPNSILQDFVHISSRQERRATMLRRIMNRFYVLSVKPIVAKKKKIRDYNIFWNSVTNHFHAPILFRRASTAVVALADTLVVFAAADVTFSPSWAPIPSCGCRSIDTKGWTLRHQLNSWENKADITCSFCAIHFALTSSSSLRSSCLSVRRVGCGLNIPSSLLASPFLTLHKWSYLCICISLCSRSLFDSADELWMTQQRRAELLYAFTSKEVYGLETLFQ